MREKTDRFRPLNPDITPRFAKLLSGFEESEKNDGTQEPGTFFHALIEDAAAALASDLHLDPEENHYCLRIRKDGVLHDARLLPTSLGERVLNHFKVMADLDPTPALRPMEGWIDYDLGERKINLRITCAPAIGGDKLSIRLLDPQRIRVNMQELGLATKQSDHIKTWISDIQGMFLVVGPVGSGKTTTLYALVDELRHRERSIVTIEDPVEYRIEGVAQMQVSQKRDFTFAKALKSILRLDPDYIMVGEMRDARSADAAMDAAMTGKVLLSTLHAKDAVGAITALRNYGIEDFEIAAMLELVAAQRLVRKLCPECKREESVKRIDRTWMGSVGREPPEKVFYPQGCEACGGLGYAGRTGIFEIWNLGEKEKEMLLQHPDEQSLRKQVREWALPSLLDAAWSLLETGVTSPPELRSLGNLGD
ncbi:MAG: GspE/PulE family protein [Opitutales bacterium]